MDALTHLVKNQSLMSIPALTDEIHQTIDQIFSTRYKHNSNDTDTTQTSCKQHTQQQHIQQIQQQLQLIQQAIQQIQPCLIER
jgi:hypothetical protein